MIEPETALPETDWQAASRPTQRVGHAVEWHARIGSTNDRARALLDDPDADGLAVVADEQTAGRGRLGRTWVSPPGVNLTVSVALRPRLDASEAWRLGLACALAAADACSTVAPVALKWPNDLVAEDGRKVGGMLIETIAEGGSLAGAVIGIGINVNWPRASMPASIRDVSTSLADLAATKIDRVALLASLLEALSTEVTSIEAGASPLERYRARCVTLGTEVEVWVGEAAVRGFAIDIDPTGSLVLEADDGRHILASGEVRRVRPAAPA